MQKSIFEILQDHNYHSKKVMIGLSGGINSAAALVYLCEEVDELPEDIYLYYSHLKEHSPDTKDFVLACVEYAKKHFKNVIFETSDNSMTEYCRNEFKGIPQPKITPCTKFLKLMQMTNFMEKHSIELDIVGYVRHEYSRMQRQIDRGVKNKDYLIAHLSDEDCFSIVKKHIGWYPDIYKLKWDDNRISEALEKWGSELHPKQYNTISKYHNQGYNNMRKSYRVFKHNNCLPCKNMHQWEIFLIRIFYPDYYKVAKDLEIELDSYWGRAEEILDENSDCAICVV